MTSGIHGIEAPYPIEARYPILPVLDEIASRLPPGPRAGLYVCASHMISVAKHDGMIVALGELPSDSVVPDTDEVVEYLNRMARDAVTVKPTQ